MQGAPLVPLQNPLEMFAKFGVLLPTGGITLVLAVVFGIWLIYTIVVTYHWFKYSHGSMATLPVLFVHLVVSVGCMTYALTGGLLPTL